MIWFAVAVIWMVNFGWIFVDTVKAPKDQQTKQSFHKMEPGVVYFHESQVLCEALVPDLEMIRSGIRKN
jgi:hypothetical protein